MRLRTWAVCATGLMSLVFATRGLAGPPETPAPMLPSYLPTLPPVDRPQDMLPPAGRLLDRPLESPPPPDFVAMPEGGPVVPPPFDPPLGFTGKSSVLTDTQPDGDFVPMEDR